MTNAIDQVDPKSVIVTNGSESLPQVITRAVAEGRTSIFDYLAWLDANPSIGAGRDPRARLPRGLSVRVPRPEPPSEPKSEPTGEPTPEQ